MTRILLDTNILLRTLQPHHVQYPVADGAVNHLFRQNINPLITAQSLVELWAVSTRPVENNGLGMDVASAIHEMERIKGMFELLPDTPAIYPAWESLVRTYQVTGKPAHDARLVAAMRVHGVDAILTFDRAGFARYSGIEVIHPADVAAAE